MVKVEGDELLINHCSGKAGGKSKLVSCSYCDAKVRVDRLEAHQIGVHGKVITPPSSSSAQTQITPVLFLWENDGVRFRSGHTLSGGTYVLTKRTANSVPVIKNKRTFYKGQNIQIESLKQRPITVCVDDLERVAASTVDNGPCIPFRYHWRG